ncbi:uncharacterized protein VTP21DRAFT_8815 [Calcarisporiella thermophila]|uniref:uncharacterized protein n=1 Tax=Calcarisporiella thermophila TaxID=911321 RepID=UPI003744A4C0
MLSNTVLIMIFFVLLLSFLAFPSDGIQPQPQREEAMTGVNLLPSEWEVLGPFPTGMREQDFGADPLEAFGGIDSLSYNPSDMYPSELVDGGFTTWMKVNTMSDRETVGPVKYDNVRWDFNRIPFGWASSQFQSWARSTFTVPQNVAKVVARCFNVGEFYVDSKRYSGDWYAYKSAAHVLHLSPGQHTIRVRVVNEIRIFGMNGMNNVTFGCTLTGLPSEVRALVPPDGAILPEVVENAVLSGELGRFPLLNLESEWEEVTGVKVVGDSTPLRVELLRENDQALRIAPSQQRFIPVKFTPPDSGLAVQGNITLQLSFNLRTPTHTYQVLTHPVMLAKRTWGEPYQFTFLDSDGTVQYCMARPPLQPSVSTSPILVALHGAGVEASMPFWTSAYRQQKNMWVLQPTGRTPWGFDWGGASRVNVLRALAHFIKNMPGIPPQLKEQWKSVGDGNKLFITGHSNGGQGAWRFITHYPDLVLAANPAAGFTVRDYVPFYLWAGISHVDPMLLGILQSAVAQDDADRHTSNLVGLPILARAGAIDDNVPPWNSRKLVRLAIEHSHNISAPVRMSEVPDQSHWFDTVMDDDFMQAYIDRQVAQGMPSFPSRFTLSVLNPAYTGSKGGVRVEQLEIPFRLGKVEVEATGGRMAINTTNVRRLAFEPTEEGRRGPIQGIVVDGTELSGNVLQGGWLVREEGKWRHTADESWRSQERHPGTYGPIVRILESAGPVLIITAEDPDYLRMAQTIAHDLYLYGGIDSEIVVQSEKSQRPEAKGNIIYVGVAERRGEQAFEPPLSMTEGVLHVGEREYSGPGLGALYLEPLGSERLALRIVGTDVAGVQRAARMFPRRTSMMLPEFVVVGKEMDWKGAGGILATGYYTNAWRIETRMSYFT